MGAANVVARSSEHPCAGPGAERPARAQRPAKVGAGMLGVRQAGPARVGSDKQILVGSRHPAHRAVWCFFHDI